MIEQFLAITRNTFIESIRQPIYLVLIAIGLIALGINPGLSTFTLHDDTKFLVDMGLATIFLCGLLIAAFVATSVVSVEIENKTVLALVSKPVSRPIFVLGKYAGVSAAILVAACILAVALLLTERHGVMQTARDHFDQPVLWFGFCALIISVLFGTFCNYFYGWAFTSCTVGALFPLSILAWLGVLAFDKQWQFQAFQTADEQFALSPDFKVQLLIALGGVFLSLLIMSAIAIAASTRLGRVMTTAICIIVFMLGLLADSFFGSRAFDADPKARIISVTVIHDVNDDFSDAGDTYHVRLDKGIDVREDQPMYLATDNLGLGMLGAGQCVLNDRNNTTGDLVKIDDKPMARAPRVDDFLLGRPPRIHLGWAAAWAIAPNLQALSLGDALNQEHPIPWSHVRLLVVYSLAYILAMLALAVTLFQTREVG